MTHPYSRTENNWNVKVEFGFSWMYRIRLKNCSRGYLSMTFVVLRKNALFSKEHWLRVETFLVELKSEMIKWKTIVDYKQTRFGGEKKKRKWRWPSQLSIVKKLYVLMRVKVKTAMKASDQSISVAHTNLTFGQKSFTQAQDRLDEWKTRTSTRLHWALNRAKTAHNDIGGNDVALYNDVLIATNRWVEGGLFRLLKKLKNRSRKLEESPLKMFKLKCLGHVL